MSMDKSNTLESYPVSVFIISTLVSLLIYGIGAYLISLFGLIWVMVYLAFVLFMEFRLLRGHCVDCYYFGRTCAFGKGYVSSLLFPKGDPDRFCRMTITWKEILPDFLVFMIPVLAGVLSLVLAFSWLVLVLVIALILLGFAGNAFVRGNLACRYCKQRELGCPAEQLFNKRK